LPDFLLFNSGPDGVKRPNPFWNEIYNHGRRF
jgi:hypothetical protein